MKAYYYVQRFMKGHHYVQVHEALSVGFVLFISKITKRNNLECLTYLLFNLKASNIFCHFFISQVIKKID